MCVDSDGKHVIDAMFVSAVFVGYWSLDVEGTTMAKRKIVLLKLTVVCWSTM